MGVTFRVMCLRENALIDCVQLGVAENLKYHIFFNKLPSRFNDDDVVVFSKLPGLGF